ncbi:MAG: TIM barrel protein [Planctomycetes bacterium]|nr:TIM barrel protein [Planctomycetota bacterium]
MLNFCVNLNFFYGELPFLERFAAAARDGFKAVEFLSPYENEPAEVKKALTDHGLAAILFNGAIGNWEKGERGLAALAGRDDEFRDAVLNIGKYASALGCARINLVAGRTPEPEPEGIITARLVERFRFAADQLAAKDVTLLLEHINPYDMPGYVVTTPAKALAVVEQVDRPNVKIQYDIYHAQRMAGELTAFLRANIARIGHIQVADNPGRNQPGTGEINYPFIFAELERLGYANWIGLEYKPLPNPAASLGWLKAFSS